MVMNLTSISELDQELSRQEGQQRHCDDALIRSREVKQILEADHQTMTAGQTVLQEVARMTQQQLEYRLSELTSLALETVFPDPYKLKLTFENQRGRTVAQLWFVDREGNEIDPMDSVGGGPVDVAALALRLSLICASRPRPRPTVLLDEPFRYVSRDLQPRVCQMLREVADRLKIQFIIVTHEDRLTEVADRVFRVTQSNRVSSLEVRGEAARKDIADGQKAIGNNTDGGIEPSGGNSIHPPAPGSGNPPKKRRLDA